MAPLINHKKRAWVYNLQDVIKILALPYYGFITKQLFNITEPQLPCLQRRDTCLCLLDYCNNFVIMSYIMYGPFIYSGLSLMLRRSAPHNPTYGPRTVLK